MAKYNKEEYSSGFDQLNALFGKEIHCISCDGKNCKCKCDKKSNDNDKEQILSDLGW